MIQVPYTNLERILEDWYRIKGAFLEGENL